MSRFDWRSRVWPSVEMAHKHKRGDWRAYVLARQLRDSRVDMQIDAQFHAPTPSVTSPRGVI